MQQCILQQNRLLVLINGGAVYVGFRNGQLNINASARVIFNHNAASSKGAPLHYLVANLILAQMQV